MTRRVAGEKICNDINSGRVRWKLQGLWNEAGEAGVFVRDACMSVYSCVCV